MIARRFISAWLHAGCARTPSLPLRRKITMVNAAGLVLLGILLPLGVAYQLSGNPALIRAGLIQLPLVAVAAVLPALNRRGHHAVARWLLMIGCTTTVVVAIEWSSGTLLDLHFVLIVIAMTAGLVFPFAAWRAVALLAAVDSGLFLWFEFRPVAPPVDLLPLPDVAVLLFRFGYIGVTVGAILVVTWINERSTTSNEHALEERSGVDPLTGLANRRRMLQRLTEMLVMSKRIHQYVGVLYLDLDHFKPLNDRAGHDAGDQLLREVANRLMSCVRQMDLAARVGGDEFVVVISHLGSDQADATARLALVGETIRESLARPYHVSVPVRHGESVQVEHECTASIGGAVELGHDQDSEPILGLADAAMFRAKSAGGGRVVIDDGQLPQRDGRADS